MEDLTIIGGGAAGMFAAIAAKESNPSLKVTLFEKSNALLSKVRVSGGGRCNVTHACFEPSQLIQYYPRGHKELLGAFHRFNPKDTIAWFKKEGVLLKTEVDGRMFPVTDSSETIIACLLKAAQNNQVAIHLKSKLIEIEKKEDLFYLHFKEGAPFPTRHLLLATGSSPDGYRWAQHLGHTIQPPVPSLFTFNIPHFSLADLSGISVDPVKITLVNTRFSQLGPLLITHFGFSGPAVLKLSAWGARVLNECNYRAECLIRWLPDFTEEAIFHILKTGKKDHPQKSAATFNPFPLPKNLWKRFVAEEAESPLLSLSDKFIRKLAIKLQGDLYQIEGKTTHKEEFVTCGGVTLSEVDFKTLQSKVCPGLFFAGEILDIDGVTGGFNFQNAWTTGFIVGHHGDKWVGSTAQH
jgi:predicted Rossmann fold flavoprotein